jgi:histidinol-phosphate aminotransferase
MTRPNNPTSRLIPLSLLRAIAERVPDAIVVSDEAYVEFADSYREQTAARLINEVGNVLVTRTFSKAYGIPNLRVGYALGPADAIEYLFKIKPKWNVGDVAQRAAIGALRDHDHFERTLEVVSSGRRYLSDRLGAISGLDVLPEPQGNFLMVRVREAGFSAEAFTNALGAEGFIIRGDFHPDYVRISMGRPTENEALVRAVENVVASGR